WAQSVYSPEELAVVAASTSLCFDLSIFELFVTLSCGGQVMVLRNVLEVTARQPLTLLNTVPSLMAELLRSRDLPASVRTINLAGEPLPLSLVRAAREQAPQARVVNLYGPSEDTTYSTYCQMPEELDGPPSIGGPIWNTQAYVLDEGLQPAPVGVVGE